MSDLWAENEVYRARIAELEAEVERLANALSHTKHIGDFEVQAARIAELEVTIASYDAGVSDREKLVWEELNARIAALEAEVDRLKAQLIAPWPALSGE